MFEQLLLFAEDEYRTLSPSTDIPKQDETQEDDESPILQLFDAEVATSRKKVPYWKTGQYE